MTASPQKDLFGVTIEDRIPYLRLPIETVTYNLFNNSNGPVKYLYLMVDIDYPYDQHTVKAIVDAIRSSDRNVMKLVLYMYSNRDLVPAEFTDRDFVVFRAPRLTDESKKQIMSHFPPPVEFKLSSFNLSGLTYVRDEKSGWRWQTA